MTGGAQAARVASGQQGELAMGFWGPKSLALQHQAPWEGALEGRPRFRVSPQEAGRPEPLAVRHTELQAEVSALASGSVCPSVLARGAFIGLQGSEGPTRSPTPNDRQRP